jgi:hypothetical protein
MATFLSDLLRGKVAPKTFYGVQDVKKALKP